MQALDGSGRALLADGSCGSMLVVWQAWIAAALACILIHASWTPAVLVDPGPAANARLS